MTDSLALSIEHYLESIKLNPGKAEALYNIANVFS